MNNRADIVLFGLRLLYFLNVHAFRARHKSVVYLGGGGWDGQTFFLKISMDSMNGDKKGRVMPPLSVRYISVYKLQNKVETVNIRFNLPGN